MIVAAGPGNFLLLILNFLRVYYLHGLAYFICLYLVGVRHTRNRTVGLHEAGRQSSHVESCGVYILTMVHSSYYGLSL